MYYIRTKRNYILLFAVTVFITILPFNAWSLSGNSLLEIETINPREALFEKFKCIQKNIPFWIKHLDSSFLSVDKESFGKGLMFFHFLDADTLKKLLYEILYSQQSSSEDFQEKITMEQLLLMLQSEDYLTYKLNKLYLTMLPFLYKDAMIITKESSLHDIALFVEKRKIQHADITEEDIPIFLYHLETGNNQVKLYMSDLLIDTFLRSPSYLQPYLDEERIHMLLTLIEHESNTQQIKTKTAQILSMCAMLFPEVFTYNHYKKIFLFSTETERYSPMLIETAKILLRKRKDCITEQRIVSLWERLEEKIVSHSIFPFKSTQKYISKFMHTETIMHTYDVAYLLTLLTQIFEDISKSTANDSVRLKEIYFNRRWIDLLLSLSFVNKDLGLPFDLDIYVGKNANSYYIEQKTIELLANIFKSEHGKTIFLECISALLGQKEENILEIIANGNKGKKEDIWQKRFSQLHPLELVACIRFAKLAREFNLPKDIVFLPISGKRSSTKKKLYVINRGLFLMYCQEKQDAFAPVVAKLLDNGVKNKGERYKLLYLYCEFIYLGLHINEDIVEHINNTLLTQQGAKALYACLVGGKKMLLTSFLQLPTEEIDVELFDFTEETLNVLFFSTEENNDEFTQAVKMYFAEGAQKAQKYIWDLYGNETWREEKEWRSGGTPYKEHACASKDILEQQRNTYYLQVLEGLRQLVVLTRSQTIADVLANLTQKRDLDTFVIKQALQDVQQKYKDNNEISQFIKILLLDYIEVILQDSFNIEELETEEVEVYISKDFVEKCNLGVGFLSCKSIKGGLFRNTIIADVLNGNIHVAFIRTNKGKRIGRFYLFYTEELGIIPIGLYRNTNLHIEPAIVKFLCNFADYTNKKLTIPSTFFSDEKVLEMLCKKMGFTLCNQNLFFTIESSVNNHIYNDMLFGELPLKSELNGAFVRSPQENIKERTTSVNLQKRPSHILLEQV